MNVVCINLGSLVHKSKFFKFSSRNLITLYIKNNEEKTFLHGEKLKPLAKIGL
jgi:hypothetical protein